MSAAPLHVVRYSIYHSPNAYLGAVLAERLLAGLPVQVEKRPLLVPRSRGVLVADLVGGRETPRHGGYHREDCRRWADRHGVPLAFLEPGVFQERAALEAFDAAECPGVPIWILSPESPDDAPERFWGKDRVELLAQRVTERSQAR